MAEEALDRGMAWFAGLSMDARWLAVGSTLVLGANVLGMSLG